MASAVKIKAPSETLANGVEGIKGLTADEIKNRTAQLVTTEFASADGGGSIKVGTGGAPANFTSVGTFVDTVANAPVGTHPWAGGSTTVNTYTFSQGTATTTDGKTAIPLILNDDGTLGEASDAEIDTLIIDACITAMVQQDANTCGQYWFAASAPSGGTWTSRGTVSDTQVDGTTVTKTLWQKTAPTTVITTTANRTVVKYDATGGIQEMTDAEVELLVGRFRNRIAANDVGTYVCASAAPGTGTWQQMGETITDQRKTSANQVYSGAYSGAYVGYFSGSYTGSYTGAYRGYYTGYYSGAYAGSYNRYFGGYLHGTFTGYYTGAYTGTYTGGYSGAYSGAYLGAYNRSFTGSYTGAYTGATVQSTSATITSRKLFLRIA